MEQVMFTVEISSEYGLPYATTNLLKRQTERAAGLNANKFYQGGTKVKHEDCYRRKGDKS